jgi:hypothetical protein
VAGTTPVPVISPAPSPAATPPIDIPTLAQAVTEQIRPQLKGLVQSQVDRTTPGVVRSQIKRLAEKLGIDETKITQAQREIVVEDMADERLLGAPSEKGDSEAVRQRTDLGERTNDLLARLSRDLNVQVDPAEVDALAKSRPAWYSPEEWLGAVESHVKAKAQSSRVGVGAATREIGGPPPPAPDLRRQYDEALAKIPRGNIRAIVTLKQEFRKKGLAV